MSDRSGSGDPPVRPSVLVCAGLDPSGGAGIIADVRVATQLGARPVGVITALTVQNTTGVIACEAMRPDTVRDQLEHLLSDVEVTAVKIGMIGSADIAVAIGHALALTRAQVVWDPILSPSRGDVPLTDSLLGRALAALRPHVTLLTPNARELAYLVGRPIDGHLDAIAAGVWLANQLDLAVLVKGGHLGGGSWPDARVSAEMPVSSREAWVAPAEEGVSPEARASSEEVRGCSPEARHALSEARHALSEAGSSPEAGRFSSGRGSSPEERDSSRDVRGTLPERPGSSPEAIDVLCTRDGTTTLRGPRVAHGEDVHGTGCALSTAIATYLAHGVELVEACRRAKQFVAERIAQPAHPGRGAPAVV